VLKPLLWNTNLCCSTVRAALPKPDVVFKEFLLSLELPARPAGGLGTFGSSQKHHIDNL
jgi:hypothetical protein